MTLTEYLNGLGAVDWSIDRDANTGTGVRVTYRVFKGEDDTHTAPLETVASGDGWWLKLKGREKTEEADGGTVVVEEWGDSMDFLYRVPCNVYGASSRVLQDRLRRAWADGRPVYVSARDILAAAAASAAAAGYTLVFTGVDDTPVGGAWVSAGTSVGSVLDELANLMPNLNVRVSGGTVSVDGGCGAVSGTAATARIFCTPAMRAGTLTVGSTVVDLAALYERNRASLYPWNWAGNCARLVGDALALCAEARVERAGSVLLLTAREAGAAGNDITLALTGCDTDASAATATVTPGEDLDAAGTLTDGEHTVELEALGEFAEGYLVYNVPGGQGFTVDGKFLTSPADDDVMSADAWNAQLRAAGCPVECVSVEVATGDDDVQVDIRALVRGTAGNAITLEPDAGNAVSGRTLTGGADGGRTLGDLVDAINAEDDFPFTAEMLGGTVAQGGFLFVADYSAGGTFTLKRGDTVVYSHTFAARAAGNPWTLAGIVQELEDDGWPFEVYGVPENNEIDFQAKEPGERWNTELSLEGSMFSTGNGTSMGTDGDGITLTAKEAGADGNGLFAAADGCFGVVGQFSGGADGYDEPVLEGFSGGSGSGEVTPGGVAIGEAWTRELDTSGWLVTRRTVSESLDTSRPRGVVLLADGKPVYAVPAGVTEHTEGVEVYDIPVIQGEQEDTFEENEEWRGEVARQVGGSNARQERDKDWVLVKGSPIPTGVSEAGPGVNVRAMLPLEEREKWREFWAQFGAFRELAELEDGYRFCTPVWHPVPPEVAYPAAEAAAFTESKASLGNPLAPATRETGNVPANYRVLGPNGMFLHIEGSFPASSSSHGNVSGLRFCRGALKQYVIVDEGGVKGWSRQQVDDFFDGSVTVNVAGPGQPAKFRTRRYTCLTVAATFINRRRKRYQQGTNRQAPGDPDYNEDLDGGKGWRWIGDDALEVHEPDFSDYINAADRYWEMCQAAGNSPAVEVEARRVRGFDADASLDDVFHALGLSAMHGSMSYSALDGVLTARAEDGMNESTGLDDFMRKVKYDREKLTSETVLRNKIDSKFYREDDSGQPGYAPPSRTSIFEEREKRSYPMVGPSVSPSKGVEKHGKALNSFQVYFEDDKIYIAGGEVATPHGPIVVERKEIPADKWKEGRHFYVKPFYNRQTGKYEVRYKYRDTEEQDG